MDASTKTSCPPNHQVSLESQHQVSLYVKDYKLIVATSQLFLQLGIQIEVEKSISTINDAL